ncbi:leucine-rich repeat protein [uncultured Robinsoniella sp.]|uniref:leucine-rich repeat protein n=1 Tax=uncultured Robinsoniella sp. TaxID=904190 RepID=UPI00374E460B
MRRLNLMKKMLAGFMAFAMVMNAGLPALAKESDTILEREAEREVTAEGLLEGYANTTGIDQADSPTITSIEELTEPVPHLKVMVTIGSLGGFDVHLPPKDKFEGRFYQLVHPTFLDRNVSDHNIALAYDSGAYTLQTSGSGFVKVGINLDAAAAHISRTIAKNYYGYEDKIYGYIYGGSGGSMQVVGAMETTNTKLQNIWDGAVPYITASPVSLGNFNIRLFARAVLEEKAPLIKDAVSPGGSGDPYAVLNDMESEVLREVTKLGLPLQAWENYEYLLLMNNHKTLQDSLAAAEGITTNSYNEKFWTEPGYLGAEDSELGRLFRKLRDSGINQDGLSNIAYHRHIDPGMSYHTWDHLKDAEGTPYYAQIGGQHSGVGTASMMSGGASYSGKIGMKVIMIQNLMDVDSFPTDGDWYRQRVREQGLESNFRIWVNQYADHQENKYMHLDHPYPLEDLPERLINYVGSLDQALRDLSAWVEEGVEPPQSSSYEVVDSQFVLPDDAASRGGIQPVVDLYADGAKRADIAAGDTVTLEAAVQVPPGIGSIVSAKWDLYGDGNFVDTDYETLSDGSVIVRGSAVYTQPGTFYPQVRVASQREGDSDTPFARVENLGRARVVVKAQEPDTEETKPETEPETKPETKPETEPEKGTGNAKIDISKSVLSIIASQVFTGKAITPEVRLTCNGKTLSKEKDYTISYSKNVNIGKAKIVITGKGNYQGSLSTTFAINMKKGRSYTIGNYRYKVTNASVNGKGTVTVTGVKTKALKCITVLNTVKIGGKSFRITSIGTGAFKNCKKATRASIGKNVKTIEAKAFQNCKGLKKITIKSTMLSKTGKQALKGINRNAKIIVPGKKLKAYTDLLKNKGQKNTVKIKNR